MYSSLHCRKDTTAKIDVLDNRWRRRTLEAISAKSLQKGKRLGAVLHRFLEMVDVVAKREHYFLNCRSG